MENILHGRAAEKQKELNVCAFFYIDFSVNACEMSARSFMCFGRSRKITQNAGPSRELKSS